MITAEEARKYAEMCRGVVAENPFGDVETKRLFVLEDDGRQTSEDMVLGEIFKEISEQSYRGKNRAKIAIVDRTIMKKMDFTKVSSRLKDCGFDSIYGGNDKEVGILVEW